MNQENKTKFKNLTWFNKLGIIGGWIYLIIFALSFLGGFFGELWGLY